MRLCTVILLMLVAAMAFGQVSVVSTTPADNTTSVPLTTTISVTFSGAIDTTTSFDSDNNYFTNVTTVLGKSWSADRRTISFSVVLQPSSVYFLLILSASPAAGGGLPVPYCFHWTTGAAFPTNVHSVSGVLQSGGSTATPDNAIIGLAAAPFTGGSPAFIGGAVTNNLGQFTIPYVPDGTWYPIAAKDADLNGQIDPSTGDPISYGDSVRVNGTDVTGLVLQFRAFQAVRFAEARDSLSAKAAAVLPANRVLRQFGVWQVDSTGAGSEFDADYTIPGSSVVTTIWMQNFGAQVETTATTDSRIYTYRPYTDLASAALLDSVVARAERSGGKEFRRQAPPVAGSVFAAYALLGALNNTQFGWLISDTSQYYWGLQYDFQIQIRKDSSSTVTWKLFVANATTGQILALSGVDEPNGAPVPTSFALGQNYPNPFNPATTITFSLPTQSRVSIEVLNVLGQKVATLVDEVRPAGNHQIVWNAQAPTGLYFCRMNAAPTDAPSQHFTQVRKMMLVR